MSTATAPVPTHPERRNPAQRRDTLIVLVALIGVAAYALTAQSMGGAGFPLDDAWIHQTYGRNLARTGQWAYVPGVPSAGSTSPLFTVLLAIGYALHIPFLLWTYTLAFVALAAAGLIGARLAQRLYPSPNLRGVGLWTGLALGTAWHLVWAASSGMETMLFTTLTLLLIALAYWGQDSLTVRRGLVFGLAGAVTIATRPEGSVLIGLLAVLLISAPSADFWRWAVGAIIGGAVGLAPYALLNLSLNGTLLPNTFSAKQAEYAALLAQPFLTNLWAMLQPLTAGGQALLLPGVIAGLIGIGRSLRQGQDRRVVLGLAFVLWPAALIMLYVLRLPTPYQHGRYVIPALAPWIVLGVGGTFQLTVRRRSHWGRVLSRSLAVATLAMFAVLWVMGASIFGRDVQMIQSEMVVAARWLADHVPPDQLIAVHDIGAVGYFAPRPLLDLAGLASPEVIPIIRDGPALMSLMERRGARYLMVLPAFSPAEATDPRLCERYNTHGQMGGMAVYALAWNGQCTSHYP